MSILYTSGKKCQNVIQVVTNVKTIQVVKNVNILYKWLNMSIFYTSG